MPEDIATANRSRGQYAARARTAVQKLLADVDDLAAADPLIADHLIQLEGEVDYVKESLANYNRSVIRCHVLDKLTDSQAEADKHQEHVIDLETRLRRIIGRSWPSSSPTRSPSPHTTTFILSFELANI